MDSCWTIYYSYIVQFTVQSKSQSILGLYFHFIIDRWYRQYSVLSFSQAVLLIDGIDNILYYPSLKLCCDARVMSLSLSDWQDSIYEYTDRHLADQRAEWGKAHILYSTRGRGTHTWGGGGKAHILYILLYILYTYCTMYNVHGGGLVHIQESACGQHI